MKWLERLRRAPEPQAVQPPPKRSLAVSDEAVIRSSKPAAKPFDPFRVDPAAHPKAARSAMALDEAVGDYQGWAAAAISGALEEGQAFLGYPVLAELAQRPEYRRISETIARHMVRKWIELKTTGEEDKSERIAQIDAALKRMNVKGAFQRAAEQDGFFGRGHIYIDTGATDDPAELKTSIGTGHDDASVAKIGKGSIKGFKTVEAVWCYPTGYNSSDPLRNDWYKPTSWFVMGKELHSSRLLTFIGREVPDLLKPAYSFGGLSLSQMAKPYVDNWLRTRQSVADIVSAFSTFVLKTDLADALMVGGEQLFKRAALFNNMRDNRGLLITDKEGEDFDNVSAPLGGLEQLQAQAQEHMAAVSGIPTVELLGIQPAGLNASSEGEIRTFQEWIHSNQEHLFRAPLAKVIALVQLSEFGDVDPSITFDFVPLWSLNEKEMSEKAARDAQTDMLYVDGGVLSPHEVRQRLANDPDTPYQGLNVDDVPLPPMEDGESPPELKPPEPKPEPLPL